MRLKMTATTNMLNLEYFLDLCKEMLQFGEAQGGLHMMLRIAHVVTLSKTEKMLKNVGSKATSSLSPYYRHKHCSCLLLLSILSN